MSLRLAFFTPLAPLHTALADHSEGLLPYLQQRADIDLFIDEGYQPTTQNIVTQFNIYSYREFPQRAADYNLAVYVMGNNAHFHSYMHYLMRDYPGVVILHDTDLQQYFMVRALLSGQWDEYRAELERIYGKIASRRIESLALTRQLDRLKGAYPLVEPLLDWSRGAIVYNAFAYHDVLIRRPQAQVRQLKYHFYLPEGFVIQPDIQALKKRWNLNSAFIIGTFGLFHSEKRLDVCLRAFKRFLAIRPEAHYLLVGQASPGYDIPAMVRSYGLENRVLLAGWMNALEFTEHLCLPDVVIHLRYPHIGGTLYTPLRLLGLGQPAILSDIEPLAEFPEGCCVKISPDAYEEDTLVETLHYLADHPDFRRQMGQNARRLILQHYDVAQIAREHLDFFEQVACSTANPAIASTSPLPVSQLIQESAGITASWGLNENDEVLLVPIAKAIASLFSKV